MGDGNQSKTNLRVITIRTREDLGVRVDGS